LTVAQPYDPLNPLSDAQRCPSCNGTTRVLPDDELRFVCGVCGTPRVQLNDETIVLSGDEKAPLAKANGERMKRFWWRLSGIAGAVTGGFGLLTTAIFALLFGPSLLWTGLGLAVSLPFVMLAALAINGSKSAGEAIQRHVGDAWESAARDVLKTSPAGLTAKQLAEKLAISEAGAEGLLAEISVDAGVHSRITSEAKLIYTHDAAHAPAPGGAASLRIDVGATGGGQTQVDMAAVPDPLEARFEALEESMAAEEAAAAEATKQKS
jgi:hypothetical protein